MTVSMLITTMNHYALALWANQTQIKIRKILSYTQEHLAPITFGELISEEKYVKASQKNVSILQN